ncbi:hypothetical protein BCR37DRAFT_41270 [Protomyces lactucae-debilis]|uniref:Probable RNA polymerase II nuclear localization protein SLC7A6OS n=1 Tax=Protomyces lactucae-debilis TaxID=2754530 RepID=A0A1Y2FBS6_PROLT|nr:uncharacterized protein BCR37DRAFT_41270 [Protomyces lactucae-debilis]ORY81363.1 hypothetical protein BCR37DRAFT_41270 [Protomyces lactucae-debilis]
MAVSTVLRIKRKRTDDPVQILLTQEDQPIETSSVAHEQATKKRRVWQLSQSSDHRGIPVPLSTKRPRSATLEEGSTAVEPPRFKVRKRKSQLGESRQEDYRRVLDLERREESVKNDNSLEKASLAPDPRLADMLSDYLESSAAATKEAESEDTTMKEEDYVYDIYYPSAAAEAIAAAQEAITSNYGLLEHFNWDDLDQLVVEEEGSDQDGHDSEDSNAESWIGNDYPDEEEDDSDESGHIYGSDAEEEWDRDEWLED